MIKFFCLFIFLLFVPGSVYSAIVVDSLVYSQSFADTSKMDPALSKDIDLKSQPGNIILALGSTKNLGRTAFFSAVYLGSYPPSSDPTLPDTARINASKVGDGSFLTFIEFPAAPTPNTGSYIKIDLRSIRQISSVVIVNFNNSATSYRLRPRAFTLYSGVDSNSVSRVFQEPDNADTTSARYTMNIADVRPIRYMRFSIDRVDVSQATVISEIQIFGDGYVPEGAYISRVDSFATGPVNFANIFADADFEVGASISIQMRTGPTKLVDSTKWSDWSLPIYFSSTSDAAAGNLLRLNEPRKYFQYRVNLFSSNIGTPKVRGISFTYQTSLVADSTSAFISPPEIAAFTKSTMTYTVNTHLSSGSLGVDTLKIFTPAPSAVQNVLVNGSPVNYRYTAFPDKAVIGFQNTITTSSVIDVKFTTKLISNGSFPSELISKSSPWNPQNIDPKKTSTGNGWNIITSGISQSALVNIRIDPNPFTPNGDGKNDATIIDFAVANIEKTKTLRIYVFDLLGRKIRTITETGTGISPFFGDPRQGGKGILWDGKNDNGNVVSPGVYLLQISLDVDDGGEFMTKTVVVAY